MKRARTIVLAIAVVAAGGAAMIAKRLIQAPAPQIVQTSNFDTVKVLVASSDI